MVFSLSKMSPGSEWYYLNMVTYYGLRKRKKKRKKGRGDGFDEDVDDDLDLDDDAGGLELGANEPYSINQPGEPPGIWWGGGAEKLGLPDMVQVRPYRQVFRGFHPFTGQPLVQNAGMPDRRYGLESCFTPPKEYSILISQASPEDREILQAINLEAVKSALELVQEKYAFSRVGKASEGCRWVPVKLVVALHEHFSNRTQDANVHYHAQIFNLGVDDEGKFRSLEFSPIFKNQLVIGAHYRAKLASLLREKYGTRVTQRRKSFSIDDIPRKLVREHSKRRRQILKRMREKGRTGAAAAARAALETRPEKDASISREEFIERWRKTNEAAGFGDAEVEKILGRGPGKANGSIDRAIKDVLAELTHEKNHFTEQDVMLRTLWRLPHYGLDPAPVPEKVKELLGKERRIKALGRTDGVARYTTQPVYRNELRMFNAADVLAKRKGKRVANRIVEREIKKRRTMKEEQAELVRRFTQGEGDIQIALGYAGTGKTFALKTCMDSWKRKGIPVVGAAPTGQAAGVLGKEIGIECHTLTKLLGDFRLPASAAVKHHVRQFGRAARGKRTHRFRQPKPMKLKPGTILLVDESGMISTTLMRKLTELAAESGARLCLVGDTAQLPAVEGTAPLAGLVRRFGASSMVDICRQKEEWAKNMAKLFAKEEPERALALLADLNRVTTRDTRDEVIEQACLDWTVEGLRTPQRAVILANTNAVTEQANHLAQEHRLNAGVLDSRHFIRVTDEQDDDVFESRVHVGDRVLFTRNSNKYAVRNGSLGTVTAVQFMTGKIAVALDNGGHTVVKVRDFPHIRLGYSVTTHRSQGASIPRVFVIITDGGLQNLPASYVQATRAVEDIDFYTTKDLLDLEHEAPKASLLAVEMSKKPDLRLAMEMMGGPPIFNTPTSRPKKERSQPKKKRSPTLEEHEAAIPLDTAKDGTFQRLRLPQRSDVVRNGAMLVASCVDGGSPKHRHRPPPPNDVPIPYASESIRVQRTLPTPLPWITLQEATCSSQFSLIGADCQDYVRVQCHPNEEWRIHVDDPLALISPQDDLTTIDERYSNPAILRQFQALDQLDEQLRSILPRDSLLLSVFANMRREISWSLLTAADPERCTRVHLRRFCDMLFDAGSVGRSVLAFYEKATRPVEDLAFVRTIERSAAALPCPPEPQLVFDLGWAIVRSHDERPLLDQCIRSMTHPAPWATPETIQQAIQQFTADVYGLGARYFRENISNEQQQTVMNTLLQTLREPVDYVPDFPDVLNKLVTLNHETIKHNKAARFLYLYATATLRGLDTTSFADICKLGEQTMDEGQRRIQRLRMFSLHRIGKEES